MTLNDDIDRLSRISLFVDFPAEQLRLLAFGSKRQLLRGEEVLFSEGETADGGYVVVSGQVDIVVIRGNREIILASQLENSLIGEMALITNNKRVASAVARTNVELLFIPRELFKRMLFEYPNLALLMHQRITQSVRLLLSQMSEVQTKLEEIPNLSPVQLEQVDEGQ